MILTNELESAIQNWHLQILRVGIVTYLMYLDALNLLNENNLGNSDFIFYLQKYDFDIHTKV